MEKGFFHWTRSLLLLVSFLFLFPSTSLAEKIFGGLTFTGDRQGVCIEIAGECSSEDILFELATCDSNNAMKEKYKKRMPFTLLVPKGIHELVIKKDGQKVIRDKITIEPEKILEYQLP